MLNTLKRSEYARANEGQSLKGVAEFKQADGCDVLILDVMC